MSIAMERKPGRPKGSKTESLPTARTFPEGCPECGSTDREPLGAVITNDFNGEHDGRPYTSFSKGRTQCRNCGRCYFFTTYDFDPNKWENAARDEADREERERRERAKIISQQNASRKHGND